MLAVLFLCLQDGGNVVFNLEVYGDALEFKTIGAFWVVLVMWPWIAGKDTFYGLPLSWCEVVLLADRIL